MGSPEGKTKPQDARNIIRRGKYCISGPIVEDDRRSASLAGGGPRSSDRKFTARAIIGRSSCRTRRPNPDHKRQTGDKKGEMGL